MAGSKSSMVLFMVMMVAAMQMQTSMAQTRHVVGDALGWTIPPNGAGAAIYSTWASGKNFTVGDTLFFNFTTGLHDVAEVSQAAYGPCTTTNPISRSATGPATVTLSTAGTHYYICTVGAHCSSLGQKVSVMVVSAAAAPTTPPPAAAPTTPPPAATPTTPPPTATPAPAPVSPPTTTPTPAPAPGPSTTTPPPTSSPAPSPNTASPPAPPTSGPSPSGSTTPSPSGSTTPSPAGDNTPTPPAPSSAVRSSTAVVPSTLLVAVFALFF